MTNGCPLLTWGSNSRIEHTVANRITGSYTFVDVAVVCGRDPPHVPRVHHAPLIPVPGWEGWKDAAD
eukprot:3931733-Prymnesium_polylepis.3